MELELDGGKTLRVTATDVYLNLEKGFRAVPLGSVTEVKFEQGKKPKVTVFADTITIGGTVHPENAENAVVFVDAVLQEHRRLLEKMGHVDPGIRFPQPLDAARQAGVEDGRAQMKAEFDRLVETRDASEAALKQRLEDARSKNSQLEKMVLAEVKRAENLVEERRHKDADAFNARIAELESRLGTADAKHRADIDGLNEEWRTRLAKQEELADQLRARIESRHLAALREADEVVRAAKKQATVAENSIKREIAAALEVQHAEHEKIVAEMKESQLQLENSIIENRQEVYEEQTREIEATRKASEKQLAALKKEHKAAVTVLKNSIKSLEDNMDKQVAAAVAESEKTWKQEKEILQFDHAKKLEYQSGLEIQVRELDKALITARSATNAVVKAAVAEQADAHKEQVAALKKDVSSLKKQKKEFEASNEKIAELQTRLDKANSDRTVAVDKWKDKEAQARARNAELREDLKNLRAELKARHAEELVELKTQLADAKSNKKAAATKAKQTSPEPEVVAVVDDDYAPAMDAEDEPKFDDFEPEWDEEPGEVVVDLTANTGRSKPKKSKRRRGPIEVVMTADGDHIETR